MHNLSGAGTVGSDIHFRLLYENSFDAVLLTKPDGNIISANPAACQMFGMTESELKLVGRKGLLVIDNRVEQVINECERTGKARAELTFKHKDGSTFEGEVTSSLFTDTDGIAKTSMIIRDITERKKAQDALIESEERYSQLSMAAFEGIIITRGDKILDANNQFAKIFGYELSELIGKSVKMLLVPESLKVVIEQMQSGYEGPTEFLALKKDGSVFSVEGRAKSINYKGYPARVSAILDITERKKAEEKLRQSDMIFENSLDMICIAGFDGYFKVLNPAWSKTLGWNNEELLSKPWIEFVHPEDKEATINRKANLVGGQEVFQFANRYICKDGSIRWLSWNSFPHPKEKIIFGIARDITERKEADDRLALVNEKLRVTGSLTRHDVKNKLTIIKSNVYLLKKRIGDNPELAKYLEVIDLASDASNKLFEFSSTYEKIGAEARSKINVAEYFKQASVLLNGLQAIKITNECEGLIVLADSLLRQLFYNLLDNSLKHGQKVTHIRLYFKNEGNGVKLFYEDNGVGIPQVDKIKLFTEGFTTGNGSGLGLLLCKKMVEAYGWTITEEGQASNGVKFAITIPKVVLS